MTVLRALVTIPNASSALPKDAAVNTWHFGSTNPSGTAASAQTALETFYGAIDALLSTNSGSPATVRWYDLSDGEPRTPFLTDTFTLSVGTGVAHPNECAICLSYRADLVSGANPARRRGRIYLGPIDGDAGSVGAGDVRVSAGTLTSISNAAAALAGATITDSVGWVVFSPTTAGPAPWSEGTLDASSYPVTAGFVDNSFDTVRSRGLLPTARTSWVAV